MTISQKSQAARYKAHLRNVAAIDLPPELLTDAIKWALLTIDLQENELSQRCASKWPVDSNVGMRSEYDGPIEPVATCNYHGGMFDAALDALESAKQAYESGRRDGIRRFAWLKDGTQYVGTSGKTLAEALTEVDKE